MDQISHMFPKLSGLPTGLSDGAISVVLSEGIPTFRASTKVVERIDSLLEKSRDNSLSTEEVEELKKFEEIDDYLSHLNRVVRNLQIA